MRTFSTLYNNKLTGVFPEVKAKSASTVTAKDGTPFKAINIDDTSWGWIQALLDFVGQTPDGVAETYDQSQIFNAMREAFSTARKQTLTAAGPVVFGKTNQEVEVDLSLGNLAIDQLPVPDFIGQKVHIYGVGTGIGSIADGTGLYTNGVYFTENTGGVFLTAISTTEWRAENGVTADYVSGGINVKQFSNGLLESTLSVAFSGTYIVNLPVSNSDTGYYVLATAKEAVARFVSFVINSASTFTLYGWTDAGATTNMQVNAKMEGKY